MSIKFLEMPSAQNLPPVRFELSKVEKNIYMLKTKDASESLVETLDAWLESNDSMTEPVYSYMLLKRSTMRQVLSEGISHDLKVESLEMTESKVAVTQTPDEPFCYNNAALELVAGKSGNLEEMTEEAD
jgi:hypothetical protein